MPDAPTPIQTALSLRAPIEPSEGYYAMVRRVLDGLAVLIEQNEKIFALLEASYIDGGKK